VTIKREGGKETGRSLLGRQSEKWEGEAGKLGWAAERDVGGKLGIGGMEVEGERAVGD
jgi:hypothetical protein